MGLDLRGTDASGLDFSGERDLLKSVTFDSSTGFPEALPDGFLPEESMEIGKNPGLGIRALQERGITGEGVTIAIVDQGLNTDHPEYGENVTAYELLHCLDEGAQMHGSAVTSIAVGKTCGVAPGAKVCYIASTFGTYGFIAKAFETGTVRTIEYEGKQYELGTIINPEALVDAVR